MSPSFNHFVAIVYVVLFIIYNLLILLGMFCENREISKSIEDITSYILVTTIILSSFTILILLLL
uniref:p7 n=1 Tax=Olive leaf yellowing-associated virus TaxID=82791 RepID=A0A7L9K4D4_9CLOS|nr:p7 [Olive leaf yellowing-associated virus]